MASLAPTFGRGAMTNSWTDIKNADLVIVMGGNAAEAHPCGFKWVTEAKANRGARLIVVDPRFTRTASVADFYAPIRPGTDIAFLLGVISYCIENDKIQQEYVEGLHQRRLTSCKDGFGFSDGLFTGYDEEKREYDKSTWDYEIGSGRLRQGRRRRCSIRVACATCCKRARRALHAGDGRAHLRHAEGQVPQGLRNDRRDRRRRPRP